MSEQTLERELARRAEDVRGTPFSFEDVRGKAVSIRRRRRAAVASGVAAAVALVVLVPTILAGGDGPKSDGIDPAPSVPGHAAVLHDRTLTLPDGDEVTLDVGTDDVLQLGVLTDGRIVVALQDPYVVRVYQPDGAVQSEFPVQSNAITMSAADDAVAWVGQDFRINVLASGEPEPTVLDGVPMPGEAAGSIDAVLSPEHLLVGDGSTTTGEVTLDGYREIGTSQPLRVSDVSPGGDLWAVQYPDRSDPQFGCAGLYDPEAAAMVATSCDTALLEFAPDGEHLTGARGDNQMWGSVEVFDRDLRQVGSFEPDGGGVVKDWAWDDAGHVLVAVGEDAGNPTWQLIRTGLDGATAEVVDGPIPGPIPELASAYLLSD